MARARHVSIAIVGLAVICAVSACSGTSGTASPMSTGNPSPTTGGQQSGSAAPEIANPLPASLIQGDPCAVLTSSQVDSLFSRPPQRGAAEDTGVAKSCSWSDVDRGSQIGIQLVYSWKDGLGTVYATQGRGFFKELAPVQGYPVVAYGPSDDRSKGFCNVAIGIANNAAFEADVRVANAVVGQGDPCDDARKVADLAITTLKGGA
ncbi:DUF3558 domain-containing protein [Amycolatopsis sp. FDAARGOS 1241]|uniref:DUF3558 domain-containing protein n=1 Tax=Amycolatopsis sp. FDAARGOS 1241 TaxID=2778070 RepID=UPI001951DE08|nr:DUF3558 domain-containing protein [Amycolatopsis sp. FDAARGOS 1241]QRP48088.1 DUF3558 domain-containing protein [Amycolatopsis sp. FDAARGOS 1241]